MSYLKIDPILKRWACDNDLHIYTSHQDYDIRSLDIVSPSGKRFQLWIDELDVNEKSTVHIWDFKKKRKDYQCDLNVLVDNLNMAYRKIIDWSKL